MRLFDRDGEGAQEIVAAVGLISSGVTFDKWEPLLPLGIRETSAIVGQEPVDALAAYYECPDKFELEQPEEADMRQALKYLQQTVAFFTWLKLIPTLDAQHDENGRSRRLGENEKGLTALQEYKDETNILRLAYESADALIETMERAGFLFWTQSRKYRQRDRMLIKGREEFDEYYHIGSSRLYYTLLPIMREVQGAEVEPVLGADYFASLLDADGSEAARRLTEPAKRAVALLTMKKAVERLPVQVIPEGIVQVNIQQPVQQRLKAERDARAQVAASLGADAERCLRRMEAIVAELAAAPAKTETYISGPIVHSKGMTF